MNYDAERWAEYESEKAAVAQEAFEQFCFEADIDPESEEAVLAYAAYETRVREEEERAAYEERQIEEYEWRMREEQEYRDANWE
jgi:hypothetical protein